MRPLVNTGLLRSEIVKNGYTQHRLAAELCMSENTLSAKIRGIADFTLSEMIKICDLLNITDMVDKEKIFLQ